MRTFKEVLNERANPIKPDIIQEIDQQQYEAAYAQLKQENPDWEEYYTEKLAAAIALIGFDNFEFEIDPDKDEPRYQIIKTYYSYGC